MRYARPLLHALDLATSVAMCTPANRGPDDCGSVKDPLGAMEDGIYVGQVGGTDTCLTPPGSSNLEDSAVWLRCVLWGGC
jgi:hypothetical protein